MTYEQKMHPLAMPIALVLAGGMIATAIFFSDGTSSPQRVVQNNVTLPSAKSVEISKPSQKEHIRGNISAKIVIVEYSDTECPFCKRFHETLKDITTTYKPSDVAWIYRHFPLDSLHKKARLESHALECAGELGGNDGFWKYADELYRVTPSNDGLDLAELPRIAGRVGISVDAFNSCQGSNRHKDKIQEQFDEAVAAGGRGTPFSIILTSDGRKYAVNGAKPTSELKTELDEILASMK